MSTWCDFNDLPADQCSHCTGDTLDDPKPVRIPNTERLAIHSSLCTCGCKALIIPGDTIVAVDLNGDGETSWCLLNCTRREAT